LIRNLKRDSHSAGQQLVQQMQDFMDRSSSDEDDSDLENHPGINDKQDSIYSRQKTIQPITSYRYVHHFNGKHSLSKMKSDEAYRTYFLKNFADCSKLPDTTSEIVIDDSDIDDDDDIVIENSSPVINSSIEQEHNFDEIREKALEYDRQQIKGIQLANAGANNVKIINNYSVTSSTCILM
jgi:hypothetical protein